jgi:hypothetical protein
MSSESEQLTFKKSSLVCLRISKLHIFKPKIPLWVNLEGVAMEDACIFYGNLVYFTANSNMLWSFGTRFPFWFVACTNIWQHWSA